MAIQKNYGIDVSYHQGVIDWQAVKAAGVEFVVLRAGYGNSNVDTQFVNNITGAIAAGIENIGVYWFSYAYNADTANDEVALCLKTIAPYKESINLPVWFDWEEASYSYVQRTEGISLTPFQIQTIARTWCDAVTAAGYSTGIYSNKSNASGWFKVANSGLYLWQELNCEFWYARYGANNETSLFITPAFEETALNEHPETNIFQYSDVGRISGISSQRVDLNVRYTETPDPPTPTPTPERKEKLCSCSIEYVEIRDSERDLKGIVDIAKSIIWNSTYYGVGDFEIYVAAVPQYIEILKIGNFVTRPNNNDVGIIENVQITTDIRDGQMIVVSGRFVKSILDRRHIYQLSGHTNTATILRGNVEQNVRKLVSDNAINCIFDTDRNIDILKLGDLSNISKIIIDDDGAATQKQVSYANLLEYTESVLKEYGLASRVYLDESDKKFYYEIYEGIDRSIENEQGNKSIVFSKEFDNLTGTEYSIDVTSEKNTALIGGAGEDLERFYSLLSANKKGLERKETFIDASSINRSYNDGGETEEQYSDNDYTAMLNAQGKQSLKEMQAIESFSGSIDITNGSYRYGNDFDLGDIITIQDNDMQIYMNVRITSITEIQDENGYSIEASYEND